jgi:hypothetical protein
LDDPSFDGLSRGRRLMVTEQLAVVNFVNVYVEVDTVEDWP